MNKNYIFIVAITMCLMVILCNNMVASKKSKNRKRKNVPPSHGQHRRSHHPTRADAVTIATAADRSDARA